MFSSHWRLAATVQGSRVLGDEGLRGHKHVVTVMNQETDDSSLDSGDSSRNGGKCLGSDFILRAEPTELDDGLDVWHERKRSRDQARMTPKTFFFFLALAITITKLLFTKMKATMGRGGLVLNHLRVRCRQQF